MAELTLLVPGEFILVNHALSRAKRGATGLLIVSGDENLEAYRDGATR